MKKEYDFCCAAKNPYVYKSDTRFTLLLQPEVMDFFEMQAALHGISCEDMINRYLSDCVTKKRQLSWT